MVVVGGDENDDAVDNADNGDVVIWLGHGGRRDKEEVNDGVNIDVVIDNVGEITWWLGGADCSENRDGATSTI